VEVIGDGQGIESRRLGEDGMLEEDLGLELLVAAEVGELGHGRILMLRG
jgi:hypothetical protein